MKLPEGVTVFVGGKAYRGEIPDKHADKVSPDIMRKVPESQKPDGVRKPQKAKKSDDQ